MTPCKIPDGDGMSNLQEYLVGTDPHDANSKMQLSIIYPDASPTPFLSWLAISNISYTVQYRKNVSPDSSWKESDQCAARCHHTRGASDLSFTAVGRSLLPAHLAIGLVR